MKYSPLGINLLKGDNKKRAKFWWNPEITDIFLDRIESKNMEWKTPPKWDILIFHYNDHYHHLHSKYTINRNWEVKSLKWEIMKLFFHPNKRWPRVRIQVEKMDKNGKRIFLEKEIWVLQMMEQKFGIYLPWYKLKKDFPKDYILVTKDWDYNNMKYDNLQYICKDEKTKKKLIKDCIMMYKTLDDKKIAELFDTSQWYVRKMREQLAYEGHLTYFSDYQEFQKEIWIEFAEDNLDIYKILIQSQWKLSNMEIAKLLWPKELSEAANKRFFTDKIVRARKKLTDKWLIPRFNELFESKREEIVERIKNKANSGETSQQIANAFWLKKEQVDNLIRQIKKEESEKKND